MNHRTITSGFGFGSDEPGSGGGSGTGTLPDIDAAFNAIVGRDDEELEDDGGNSDRFAHYVKHPDIIAGGLDGIEITALCGRKFRPRRNPEKYPVCPDCKEIFDSLPPGGGDD